MPAQFQKVPASSTCAVADFNRACAPVLSRGVYARVLPNCGFTENGTNFELLLGGYFFFDVFINSYCIFRSWATKARQILILVWKNN
jgi:hypothetical protein